MAIYEHLTEFAGLPVVEFPSPDSAVLRDALAAPETVAWRLHTLPHEDEATFEEILVSFLDEVDAAKVTALIVGCWSEFDGYPGAAPRDPLVAHADRFPALRSLFFGEFVMEEAEISWIQQCDVAPLLAAFPRLEEFVVRGGSGLEFPATRHGSLRRLTVQTGGLPREVTTGVLASDLPALEHLELWFGIDWYGGTTEVSDLAPLLEGEGFPNLRSLGLRNSPWGDDLVRALAGAPVLERVRVLDLSGNVLTDAGGEVLATAPAFHTLERLVIRYHFLTEAMEERLRAALPGVDLHLSEREEPDHDVDDDGTEILVYYPEVTE